MKKILVSFFVLFFTLGLFIGGSWAGSSLSGSSSHSGNETTALLINARQKLLNTVMI